MTENRMSILLMVPGGAHESSLARSLRGRGHDVLQVDSATDGVEILRHIQVDAILSEGVAAIGDGTSLLERARELAPGTVHVVISSSKRSTPSTPVVLVEKVLRQPVDADVVEDAILGVREGR